MPIGPSWAVDTWGDDTWGVSTWGEAVGGEVAAYVNDFVPVGAVGRFVRVTR